MREVSSGEISRSMQTSLEDLKLDSLDVIHSGDETFPLSDKIRAVSFGRILQDLPPLVVI